jgi:redox-sensitive bicupin YhaK (pirin superfamily)
MSNLERRPPVNECGVRGREAPPPVLLEPREVPLGGPRAMTVRRTLPHKSIRTVGAWCFVDHYGPQATTMSVPPHPHMGLQTVSWLLSGEVEHRDSLGSLQRIRPGELNVMTAGPGIAHSEYTVGDGTEQLHGVQLWVALTEPHRDTAPAFEHHANLPMVSLSGMSARVICGQFAGAESPATAYSPLVGAELSIEVGAVVDVPLTRDFEYAVLALDGSVEVEGRRVDRGCLQYMGWGRAGLRVAAPDGGRLLLLGGEPLTEHLLMWWNFVGRSHDEVEAAREQWQAGDARFGAVVGDDNPRLPAPPMPSVPLVPRPPRR